MPQITPVIAFDLDMTLVDSRDGIVATLRAVAAELGRQVGDDEVWPLIGLPLEDTCQLLFGPELAPVAVDRYRALYPRTGVPPTRPLPGAAEALAAVRAYGGRVVVVSAKVAPAVRAVLDHVGLQVDAVDGHLFGADKATALRRHGATAMVGDHPGDVRGARAAGVVAVAVPTGPHDAAALTAEAPDVLLDDLGGFTGWLHEHVLDLRLAALDARLREAGTLLVAFSGGADSALLLAAAVRALGPDAVVAATAVSPSLPAGELQAAREVAAGLGVRLETPATHEDERPGYRANDGDRCAFCKAELLDVLAPLAGGLAAVATGTNADDLVAGFRPGIRAAADRGAITPLADAGLTKAQVRAASRRWGLPTADKPAAACLASRVAYGVEVTPARLARVERAEVALRGALAAAGLAVRDLRVRDLGDRARIEVDAEAVDRVAELAAAHDAVRGAGFAAVEVDRRGFRTGAMNELLPDPARWR